MITEKHFISSHAAFWQELLPMAESYVRECNLEAARFLRSLDSRVPPDQRGIINEVGFRIFAASVELARFPAELSEATVERCIADGVHHVSRLRQVHRHPVGPLGDAGLLEAMALAERLQEFFSRASRTSPTVFPSFPGCGWLDQCAGDVLADGILFEVKAGDRSFRSMDLRQLLCYCGLNFASKSYDIVDICLVNPRSGRYVSETVEKMCQRLSGRSAMEVLADIVEYVSEPPGRYVTG